MVGGRFVLGEAGVAMSNYGSPRGPARGTAAVLNLDLAFLIHLIRAGSLGAVPEPFIILCELLTNSSALFP